MLSTYPELIQLVLNLVQIEYYFFIHRIIEENSYIAIRDDCEFIRVNKDWLTKRYSVGERTEEDIVRNKTLFKHLKETIDL